MESKAALTRNASTNSGSQLRDSNQSSALNSSFGPDEFQPEITDLF